MNDLQKRHLREQMIALSSFPCYLQAKLKEVFLFFAFDEGERLLFVYRT